MDFYASGEPVVLEARLLSAAAALLPQPSCRCRTARFRPQAAPPRTHLGSQAAHQGQHTRACSHHCTRSPPLLLVSDPQGDALAKDASAIQAEDSEIVAMIKELLETRIRPAVAEDGGDIVFKGFDEKTGIVKARAAACTATCHCSVSACGGGCA